MTPGQWQTPRPRQPQPRRSGQTSCGAPEHHPSSVRSQDSDRFPTSQPTGNGSGRRSARIQVNRPAQSRITPLHSKRRAGKIHHLSKALRHVVRSKLRRLSPTRGIHIPSHLPACLLQMLLLAHQILSHHYLRCCKAICGAGKTARRVADDEKHSWPIWSRQQSLAGST